MIWGQIGLRLLRHRKWLTPWHRSGKWINHPNSQWLHPKAQWLTWTAHPLPPLLPAYLLLCFVWLVCLGYPRCSLIPFMGWAETDRNHFSFSSLGASIWGAWARSGARTCWSQLWSGPTAYLFLFNPMTGRDSLTRCCIGQVDGLIPLLNAVFQVFQLKQLWEGPSDVNNLVITWVT